MYNTQRKNLGFTIVELLVVIVVIALLAAITTVTFRYVQARAYDSKMAAGFNQYGKLLELYHEEHGSYPATSMITSTYPYACLGEKKHYPAVDGWQEGACYAYRSYGSSKQTLASTNDSVNESLLKYSSTLPDVSYKPVEMGTSYVRGPYYFIPFEDDLSRYVIQYYSNYSGSGGGGACLWGGVFSQHENSGTDYCYIERRH